MRTMHRPSHARRKVGEALRRHPCHPSRPRTGGSPGFSPSVGFGPRRLVRGQPKGWTTSGAVHGGRSGSGTGRHLPSPGSRLWRGRGPQGQHPARPVRGGSQPQPARRHRRLPGGADPLRPGPRARRHRGVPPGRVLPQAGEDQRGGGLLPTRGARVPRPAHPGPPQPTEPADVGPGVSPDRPAPRPRRPPGGSHPGPDSSWRTSNWPRRSSASRRASSPRPRR